MKTVSISHYPDDEVSGVINKLHPLLQRIYKHRSIKSSTELDNQLKYLLPYDGMLSIDKAVSEIVDAIVTDKIILIVGDFDADGATSTAVALRLLRLFGAKYSSYLVPNRFDFGYGLTVELLRHTIDLKPDLIITVDNGISSLQGVEFANEHGINVVVTDHHLAADQLPAAAAIVNPNQPDCSFSSKSIAGVGVIFYVMMAVRSSLREMNWFSNIRPEPNIAAVLDLVALGTVADVVALDRNNRILVEQGLKRIRSGNCCPGISALLNISGRKQETCVASDLGFSIGPRLNAAGRLEDMSLGIECLLSDDTEYCRQIAEQLHNLNIERRTIEAEMLDQALTDLDAFTQEINTDDVPPALAIYKHNWHQGVIGILASRIKDRFHRPVVAFAKSTDNELKGSARSIKGFHIRDALDLIDKSNPGLIIKFGGHAMAAGLTLKADSFELFKNQFEIVANKILSKSDLQGIIYTDGELEQSDFDLSLAELLRYAAPWGQGFPEPVFDNIFIVKEWRIVGDKHLKMKLQLLQGGDVFDAIAFNTTNEQLGQNTDKIHAVYKLDINEFRNNKSLQLMVEYLEPA